ncbi:MAG: hypothetical protein IJU71_04870 [Selenomonadaceae bacterium]|nr:hypothetical protein [Selenomonadaceae bacterium]
MKDAQPMTETQLVVESAKNIYLVHDGQISERDAAKNMTRAVARYSLDNGLTRDAVKRHVQSTITDAARASGNRTMRAAARTCGGTIGTVASIAVISVVESIADGKEVDVEKIFSDMLSVAVKDFGAAVQTMSVLLPIPGLALPIALGMLTFSACSQFRTFAAGLIDQKLLIADAIEAQALSVMSEQRELLKTLIDHRYRVWDELMEDAFDEIINGALEDDCDRIADGIDTAISLVGKRVRFRTAADFDAFFADEDAAFDF